MINIKRCVKDYPNILTTFLIIIILINAFIIFFQFQKSSKQKPRPFILKLSQNSINFSLLAYDDFSSLIDLNNFSFVLNTFPCRQRHSLNGEEEDIFVMVIVHSARENFKKRKVIRKTWGSLSSITNLKMRLIFLLGLGHQQENEDKIIQEYKDFHDIVIGNFLDSYRNLTYKHIMGFKWVTYYCPSAKFIFKADDDIFVDTFQLITLLKTSHVNGIPPKKFLTCFLVQAALSKRSESSKWKVSYEEYPNKYYPDYCFGWAALMSADVVFGLYLYSRSTPYFWIDDVYVYGFLVKKLGVRHIDLIRKLDISNDNIKKWANEKDLSLPPLFGDPLVIEDVQLIYKLWNKTLTYYKVIAANIQY